MNKYLGFTVLVLTLLSGTAIAQDNPCSNKTGMDMKECYDNEFKKADSELTKVYKQLLKRDSRHKKQLVKTELNWIKWKDYECEYQSLMVEGGTAQPLLIQTCLTKLTKERTAHLKYVLDGYNSK